MTYGRRRLFAWIFLAVVVSGIAGVAVVRGVLHKKTVEKKYELPPPLVETLIVKAGDRQFFTNYAGSIEPRLEITVSSEVGGKIQESKLGIGSSCAPGQAVVILDSRNFELEIRKAQAIVNEKNASYKNAEQVFKDKEDLFKKNIISSNQLATFKTNRDSSKATLEAATAMLELANKALGDSKITPPVQGYIVEKFVEIGEMIAPGQKLFRMVAIDKVNIVFYVSEQEVSVVALNKPIKFKVDAFKRTTFEGRVTVVNKAAAVESRTFRVEIEIDNSSDDQLLPGMVVRVQLPVRQFTNRILLPFSAVAKKDDKYYVLVVNDKMTIERRPVEIQEMFQGSAVIKNGVSVGDRVVKRGINKLQVGITVRVSKPAGKGVEE